MNKTSMATFENIDDIIDLRVEMQIEDLNETLGKIFLAILMNLHK